MANTNNRGGKKPKPGTNTIPPVTGLTATILSDNNSVYLRWDALTNATTYWIYRNNIVLAIIPPTSHTDSVSKPPGIYVYEIAAVVNGMLGPKSAPAQVTIGG